MEIFQSFAAILEKLPKYIANVHKDIFEIRQIKFTICVDYGIPVGFIDLFDFEPTP